MTRTDLQKLSTVRLREARVLSEASEFSGAYYLAGYAVECGLKACYAKSTRRYDFPDKASSRRVFTHNLIELVELAGLKKELVTARDQNERLSAGWNLVSRWSEEGRYSIWTREDAEALIDAIARRKDGVLPWIRQRW